jgi:hypothetical protein
MKPWEKPRSKKKKKRGKPDPSTDVAKRYTLPASVVGEIREKAHEYGSQGRVLQVAAELLLRVESPPAAESEPFEKARMTYRIPRRTAEIIDALSEANYNADRVQVFAACMKVLKMKRIKI